MAGNAGAGFVELVPKIGAGFASQAGSELEGPMRGLGSKIGLLLGAAVAAAGAVGIGKFLKSSADEFAQVGGDVLKLTRLTGLGAEQASKLRFAAEETGIDVGQLGTAVGILSKHLAAGDKAAQSIGVSFKDASGNARPLDDVIGDIAEKFKNMPDGVQKNALAMSLFGRSGKDLIPFLNKGRDGLAELGAEAQKFGLVLTQDNLAAIQKNLVGQRQFHAALEGLRVQLGQYILPMLTKGTVFFTTFALKGIDLARKSIESFKAGFTQGLTGLSGFQGLMQQIGVYVRFLIEDFKEFWSGLTQGTDALGTAQSGFAAFGASVRAVFSGILDLLHGNAAGFAGEVAAAFGFDTSSPLFSGLKRFADAVIGFVEGTGRLIHGDIAGWAADVAAGLGFATDGRFADGLVKLGDAVRAAFEWILGHLDLVARLGEIVAGLIVADKVAGGIFSMSRAIGDLLPKLNPANTQLGQLVQLIGKVAGKTFSVGVDVAKTAGGAVGNVGADIGNKIADAIKGALNQSFGSQATGAAVGAGAQTIADKLAEKLSSSSIKDALSHAFSGAIGAAIASIGPEVLAGLAALPGFLAGFFLDMLSAILAPASILVVLVKFGDVISTFLTRTLPHLLGEAIGVAAAILVTMFLVIPLKTIAFIIEMIPKVVGAIAQFAAAAGAAIVGFFEKLPGIVGRFLAALPGIFATMVTGIFSFVVKLPENLPRYIEAAVTGMLHFFEQLPGAVASIFSAVVSSVGGFLGDMLSAIVDSPIFDGVGRFFEAIGQGFVDGWNKVDDLTGGALSQLFDSIGSFFASIGSFFSGFFDAVGAVWGAGWTALSDFFTAWWGLVSGIVGGAVDLVVSLITTGLSGLDAIWQAIWGVLGGVIDAVWGGIEAVVVGAWNVVSSVVVGGLGFLQAYWSAVWNTVFAVASAVWGAITAIVGGAVNIVTSVIAGGLNFIAGLWSAVWGGVSGAVAAAWGAVVAIVSGGVEAVVGFFTSLPGRIAGALGSVFEPLWEGFRTIVDRIITGWNSLHFGFDLPSIDTHIPGVGEIGGGHVEVGVPQLPLLDTGGKIIRGGLAVIDPFHELVNLPTGASVQPLSGDSAPKEGVHVDKIEVNNPTPEPASETLPRELARLDFLLAR